MSSITDEAITHSEDPETVSYWKAQIDAAKKASKAFKDATSEAYRDYTCAFAMEPIARGNTIRTQPGARLPVFWASVKNLQSALYSQSPTPIAKPMLDDLRDDVADVACKALERFAKYMISRTNFDRVLYQTRDDFIMGNKATNRVYFEAKIDKSVKEIQVFPQYAPPPPQQDPNQPPPQPEISGWLDDMNAPIQFEGTPVEREGGFFIEETTETLEDTSVQLIPVSYKDYLHTCNARWEDEVWWKAYGADLTKREFTKKFGEEAAKKVPFIEHHDDNTDRRISDSGHYLPDKYARVWEIWDKEAEKVRWIAEGYSEWLKPTADEEESAETPEDQSDEVSEDSEEDENPYGLLNFFPSPPDILGTIGPDSMWPTPDHVQLLPLLNQIHSIVDRNRRLIASLKIRGIYDDNIEELKDLGSSTPADGDFIGVKNFANAIVGKGGIDGVIQFFPVDKTAAVLQQLGQALETYKAFVGEMWGIPDIIRGATDPNETADAQSRKDKHYSLRFECVKRDFQRLVRDDAELITDLALSKFDDERIAEICGVHQMPPNEQGLWPQALALMKDTKNRPVRIDIETDSTVASNTAEEVGKRAQLAQTFLEGLAAIYQNTNGNQDALLVGLNVLLFQIKGMPNGKEIASGIEEMIDKLKQAQQNPQPPPPDPEQVKAQAAQQLEQIKQQGAQQIAQLDSQTKLQIEQLKQQAEAARLAQDAALERERMQYQAQVDGLKHQHNMEIEATQARADMTVAQVQAKLDQQKAAFEMQLKMAEKQFELRIEEIKAKAEIASSHADATAKIIEAQANVAQARSANAPKEEKKTEAPQVHVHMPSHDKMVTGTRSPDGSMAYHIKSITQAV